MFEFKINNKKLTMPETVDELTLGQFVALRTQKLDTVEILALLCKRTVDELTDVKFSVKAQREFSNAIALSQVLNTDIHEFFNSDRKFLTPKEVTILGKIIKIPQDLEKQPFWPSRKVKEILQEQVEATGKGIDFDPTDKIADVLAHYLYVPFTELKYNEYRAEEFKEAIFDLPLSEAVALANFFFLQWKPLFLTKKNSLLTSLLIWKKRLALKCLKSTRTLIF